MLEKVRTQSAIRALLATMLLFVLSTLGAFAQQPDDGPYRLQPDDFIRIQVFRSSQVANPDPIVADVPINRDGTVSAPFAGIVKAQGKTTAELEAELADQYRRRLGLRDPIVSVTILRYRAIRASVGGAVGRPGTFEMRAGDTVINLLNMGGGALREQSDLRRATLRRANSRETIPIDLYAMIHLGDTSQNYQVQDGDELLVPEENRNRVLVQGMIQRPGFYPYREPMTLADAVSLAGGEVPGRTRFSQTFIIRERVGQPGKFVWIHADYVRFIRKRDESQNVVLQPGDLVYFSETNTPDYRRISDLANVAFIIDRFGGGLLGIPIFRR